MQTIKFFTKPIKAKFISRPNRFVLICETDYGKIKAYLPNPGRLGELLLPGVTLYLEEENNKNRKIPHTVIAVENRGNLIMLHTHKTNDVASALIQKGVVPGLENTEILKKEVVKGKSRFDFLLRQGDKQIYLEVKSCTLFGEKVAMFPDAVTERGRRHVEELATIKEADSFSALLFIVHNSKVDYFMPEYHTDLKFAQTLYKHRERLPILPVSVKWNRDLTLSCLPSDIKLIEIPWHIIGEELYDTGSYLLVMRIEKEEEIRLGNDRVIKLDKGFYIYIGSAMKNLTKRIERHKRNRKTLHWHIDYLREKAPIHATFTIRSSERLECELAGAIKKITDIEVPRFGSSDCNCTTHLYGMKEDPLKCINFQNLLLYYRADRKIESIRSAFG